MDFLGQTLEGGYRLKRLIAEGRHSQVYEAERRGSPRRVVVKLLHPVLWDDPQQTIRFRCEGDVLRRLRHRHAVELVESVQTPGGHRFHVLELLEGETLSRRLDRDGPLPSWEVAHLVKQAAGALQTLHDLGVVHRDVEPSNLFLTVQADSAGRGRRDLKPLDLKLLDLGKALDLGDRQRGHEVVGKGGYISPEQLRGEVHETTAATDLFALAVVAYEALCGRRPFEADDDEDLLYEVSSGSFPSASGRVEGLSQQVDTVLSRALHPDRDRRHNSIETFADELAMALNSSAASGVEQGASAVGSDTARMPAAPAHEQPPAPGAGSAAPPGARIPAPPPAASAAEIAAPPAPARPTVPPPARVPVPPVPVVIPGLPLVEPPVEPGTDQVPGSEGSFNADKTVVDAAPPVQELQPIQPADNTFAQQEQVTPYVPTSGGAPYVPPAVPLMGSTAGLTPAGPQPGSHGMPPSSGAARSRGSSVALIVVFIAVGVVGLALLVTLCLHLR